MNSKEIAEKLIDDVDELFIQYDYNLTTYTRFEIAMLVIDSILSLPFVKSGRDGYDIHDTYQEVIDIVKESYGEN